MASSRAEAVVVSARQRGESGDANQGESYWWQDAVESRFGKTVWVMELDVHPADGTAYRVQSEFKVPNKLFRMRDALKGRPTFTPGLTLPVAVDDGSPTKVTIDWDAFKAQGGVAKLYPHDEPVAGTLRQFAAELRATPQATQPASPRPNSQTHPPVEGVDYDQWVKTVLTVTRRMDPAALEAHYQVHGFPAGRGQAISAVWFERVQADPVVNEWYLYDQATQKGT